MANILIGVTGGIASYKTLSIARKLKEKGNDVRFVLTDNALQFVSPLTIQSLTGNRCRCDLFDQTAEQEIDHIALAKWADLFLIAPLTANTLAKLAYGFADNLLTTIYLATTAQIVLAPAMNQQMWSNSAVQNNLKLLSHHRIIYPEFGLQACGDIGIGRLADVDEIVNQVDQLLIPKDLPLKNKKILITLGSTREPIDPVRFLSNYSSGKMGLAMAKVAKKLGAEVDLVCGFVEVDIPDEFNLIKAPTAQHMFDVVHKYIDKTDIFIGCAAVADYKIANPLPYKYKKSNQSLQLELVENPDIVGSVGNLPNRPFIVAFAAETNNLIDFAEKKLKSKKADLLVANLVSDGVFGADNNKVFLLDNQTISKEIVGSKTEVAEIIWQKIIENKG